MSDRQRATHRQEHLPPRLLVLHEQKPSLSGASSEDTSFSSRHAKRRSQHKDVVIVGSGLAGLSAALYLSQVDPSRHVTIYEREPIQTKSEGKNVASFAAAGMLAPQSERLPKGDLLDLCLASRRMFPDFCSLVESLAKESGEEGRVYLPKDEVAKDLNPWEVGYVSTGGFLAPAFAGDSVATWAPPDEGGTATWLDATQVRELEPYLHRDVIGGWWFPDDFSVDARRLTCSLRAACVAAGVQICSGPQYEITSLDLADRSCRGLWLKNGLYVHTNTVLVANGSWMRNLLPVPIEPHKGQSLSLRMPKDRPPILRRVLFAQDSYIVPKADGRLVIGATVEAGSFDADVTPAGLLHILTFALELVPALKDLPIEETWVGLRPTTPDKGPILGETPWKNLLLAGGYWRNGVLLAPKTGLLLAKLISGQKMDPADDHLLKAFAWDRFTSKEGGARISAAARYAASMHPVHRRSTGAGVSASVGTELGSYSSARSAREERQRERAALFGSEDDAEDSLEKAFERAALMGQQDAESYTFESDHRYDSDGLDTESTSASSFEGSADVLAVGEVSDRDEEKDGSDNEDPDKTNVAMAYEKILANKSNQPAVELTENVPDERPDPGFRIYHVDEQTGEQLEVPPYTSPGEFLKTVNAEKGYAADQSTRSPAGTPETKTSPPAGPNTEEVTFDGYTTIQSTRSSSREEELEAMRKIRQQNRLDQEDIDESMIGARTASINGASSDTRLEECPEAAAPDQSIDVQSAYAKIMARKAESNSSHILDMDEEERPDPGFRIYHVDEETGEKRMVPPYTSPGEFLQKIQRGKEAKRVANGEGPAEKPDLPPIESNNSQDDYNERTLDGYTTIQDANSRSSREEELKAMREARVRNRIGQSAVDESKLGDMGNLPYGE
eukprot:scaffold2043_cov166-Amphora_coffeaeformis.AAC.20